jgi:uncharacterized protein (TIGR02265 family)
MTRVRIKGSVLKSRLAFVQDLAPESGAERVLGRLSVQEQSELRSLLATKWYPFELGQHLDEAIVAELGRGKADFFERLGSASADKNLTGVHKDFLVAGNPHAFLERTPMIYSFYYDKGHREYQKIGPTEAVLTTYDAETFSVPDCATVVGWHRRALEMCGARSPRVVEEECRARGGRVCRYRVSWS